MDQQVKDYMNRIKTYYIEDRTLSIADIISLFQEDTNLDKGKDISMKSIPINDTNYYNSECSDYALDLDELNRWRIKNNDKFEVRSHTPIRSHRKYLGKILISGKKLVRKCLKWYIDPIVEQQNEFNGSVTASINSLYNQSIVLNQFMQEEVHNFKDKEVYNELNLFKSQMMEMELRIRDEVHQKIRDEQVLRKRLEEKMSEDREANRALLREIKILIEKNKTILQDHHNMLEGQAQIINTYQGQIEAQRQELEWQKQQVHDHKQLINEENTTLIEQKAEIERQKAEIERQKAEIERQKADTSYLGYKLNKIKNKGIKVEIINKNIDLDKIEIENEHMDYFMFENRFRGSREKIKVSQIPYINYFTNKSNILDIGCGRGEFLELLSENDVQAKGIDIYLDFVEFCQDKGLEVQRADALEYIKKQPNNTLGGIFMAQVAEHLEENYLLELVECCYQKMQNGACFIAETPNPTNLTTFTNSFYLDPSHIKPVHPETFKFILESVGFKDIEIIYTENSKPNYALPLIEGEKIHNLEAVNSGLNCISDLIFGSLDYAIIAKK